MKRILSSLFLRLPRAAAMLAAACALLLSPQAGALNLGTQPLYLGGSIPPLVMLLAPKDHQLFKKAYDDFTDITADGALDTNFNTNIDYFGYFDTFKCYSYNNAGTGQFEPFGITADKLCTGANAGKWSGNFLNWASMSRLDILRRLLYGGYRSTDTTTTVLERALIPTEGHSWAKYYSGSNLAQVTPFSTALTAPRTYTVTGQSKTIAASGTISFTGMNNANTLVHPLVNGDQVSICITGSTVNCMLGRVTTEAFGASVAPTFTIDGIVTGATGTSSNWTVTNLSSSGITVCNATMATGGDSFSSTAAPLLRVAVGNYSLWGVGDGTACRWGGSGTNGEQGSPNGNRVFRTELGANENAPVRNTAANPTMHLNDGSGVTLGDYTARVLACNSSLIGAEPCSQYPNANLKPTGLLQDYASGAQKKIKFGLFTGSYAKNKSGGVLRKNPDFLDSSTSASPSNYVNTVDEIDAGSGIFNTGVTGVIQTFNKIKLYGYAFGGLGSAGTYSAGGDNCGGPTPVTHTDDNCTSWGNPISEIYSETLRYLANKAASSTYTYTQAGSKDASLGLLQPAWANPVNASNYCTPLNVIVMNASVNSYDNDQFTSDFLPASTTAQTLTKLVGDYESITGNSYLIGNKGSGTAAETNNLCTPKSVTDFGAIHGICPEAPALGGSYRIAGLAHWARTNRVRADLNASIPVGDTRSLKVTSYGVALSAGSPAIQIPVPGSSPTRYVTILPALRTFNSADGDRAGGAIVDFKVIRQDVSSTGAAAPGTGKFMVSWENAQQGSDYDLDVWGTIEYAFLSAGTQIQVTTQVVYGAAGSSSAFGYVISGTTSNDGMHFHSAFLGSSGTTISYGYPNGFTFAASGAPTGPGGTVECNNCTAATPTPLSSQTYTVSAAAAATILKDPLWYMSKYGGFVDQDGNGRPNLVQEWDSKNNITGADGVDGNPDTFFPVTNPGALQQALDRAFISVLQVSSASSVATNSTSLQSGSIVYQARFNANEWSGQLLAFSISTAGLIDPVPLWDAGQLIPAAGSRAIVTFKRDTTNQAQGNATAKGVPFRWGNMSTLQQADLNKNAAGTSDAAGTLCTSVTSTGFGPAGCTLQGSLRLDYLRGDSVNEGATASKYRLRPTTKLGDIVNSTPTYVGAPSALQYGDFSPPAAVYSSTSEPTYAAWASNAARASRTPMIYAGANDGMLHGFDASTTATKGVEKLAFVPSTSYRFMTKLTDKTYSHTYYVDGSPTVADVRFQDGSWHTILTGGLNAGGQGIYALDVTDPSAFSEANANSIVLWEFNDQNDAWLGNTYSQPTVAKMNNGRFAVIFASGYNNPFGGTGDTQLGSGCATLYILYVDGGTDGIWTSGTDYRFIDVLTGCDLVNPNGLATPRTADVDGNGTADFIYAGDLNGRMWVFDVRSSNPSLWTIGNGGSRLIHVRDAAGNQQAITAPAVIYPNTVNYSDPVLGVTASTTMVLFGTGKYLEQVDDSPPFSDNTFYGIWDQHDNYSFPDIGARSVLLQQKILGATVSNPLGVTVDNAATTTVDEGGFRITTPYVPNYNDTNRTNTQFGETNSSAVDATAISVPHHGWYMDFPFSGDYANASPPPAITSGTGERVVFRPIISTGKLVFTTLVPTAVACQFGGTSFLMDLNPITGGRLANSPFDVNGDLNFTTADRILDPAGNQVYVSGKASPIGIVPTPTVIQMSPSSSGTPGKEVKVLSGSSGQLISVLELAGAATMPGAVGRRVLWRQLFTD